MVDLAKYSTNGRKICDCEFCQYIKFEGTLGNASVTALPCKKLKACRHNSTPGCRYEFDSDKLVVSWNWSARQLCGALFVASRKCLSLGVLPVLWSSSSLWFCAYITNAELEMKWADFVKCSRAWFQGVKVLLLHTKWKQNGIHRLQSHFEWLCSLSSSLVYSLSLTSVITST